MNLFFRQATSSTTIAMLQMHRPHTDPLFYCSHNGLRDAIIRAYYSHIVEGSRLLRVALSKIHFSCNLWTTTNFLSLPGIIAHLLDSHNNNGTILLALTGIWVKHDVPNAAAIS